MIPQSIASTITPQGHPYRFQSNGNEGVLHIPQSSSDWSLTIKLFSVISKTLTEGVLPLYRGAVSVFYSSADRVKLLSL